MVCASNGFSTVLLAAEVDCQRRPGTGGGMRCAHNKHGAALLCTRISAVADFNPAARTFRAAEVRIERMAIFFLYQTLLVKGCLSEISRGESYVEVCICERLCGKIFRRFEIPGGYVMLRRGY